MNHNREVILIGQRSSLSDRLIAAALTEGISIRLTDGVPLSRLTPTIITGDYDQDKQLLEQAIAEMAKMDFKPLKIRTKEKQKWRVPKTLRK